MTVEAGKEDFKVTIAEESLQLTEIKNGNVALEKDKDYTFHANTVTIKKEYIAQIKDAASTNLTFVFEDGQQKTCSIQIKKEEEQVSYNRDFTKGTEGFEKVSGDSGVLEAGKDGVTVQKDGVFIDQNSKELKNQEVEFTYDPLNNSCNYGVVLRYTSPTDYIYVGPSAQNNQHYTKWGIYNQNGRLAEIEDSGFVLSGRDVPYKVKVRVVENVVTIFLDNEEIYNGEIGGLTTNAGKVGFRTTESTGMTIQGFTQETANAPEVVESTSEAEISSEQMTVTLDANFPRVVGYTLKEGGQTVKGQELALHQVELNNKLYTPKVTSDISGAKATYHVSEESTGISFDVIMEVKENVLSMHVKNIKDDKTKLYTLNFPEHSLISMSSKDAGGMLTVNDYRSESKVELSKANAANAHSETTLAVLSNQNVAATLTGESYKNRHEVAYQTFDAGDHTSTGLWMNEFTYRGLDGEVMYEPAVKVAITADRNKDGKVDYQDGAIALRDDCMTRKTGADVVTDTWTMVAMNVGSEAQYPVMQYTSNEQAVLGENNEVVTKMENGVNVITKDGKEVARGNKIFIPWEKDDDTEGKIYHYNGDGGESTWSLPNSWKDASQVTVYKLSENGKSDKQTVSVTDGKVTLKADAKTGYVLYKEEAKKIETSDTMEWSTGSPVKDMGFDSYNFDEWKRSSSAKSVEHIMIEDNSLGNAHLYIKGKKDGQVEQVLTGLEKGQTYSASVWCITDDGRKASIEVENGDEVVSNYMDSSNVKYGVHHNGKYQTYAQRMQVRFTATSDKAVLILAAEEGKTDESVVDFDDVRVMKVNPSTNPEPAKYTYWEDFENVDQGYGVFVSTESDQSHLSQKNAVDPQYTPDVIDGNYSLKVRAGDYMRTIPLTVRLEPNTEYTVGIDYKSPSSNAFTFAVKSDKASKENDAQHAVVASEVAKDQEGKLVLKFTTGDYDDYYVDITKNAATEYYVDNFYVEQARAMNQETLGALIEEAKALDEKAYTKESFENMQAALKEAEKVHKNQNASKEEIEKAYTDLETAMENLDAYATAEDKEQLSKVIREMKSILASDYKQDEKWLAFQSALKEAESLYDSDKATQKEVAWMIRDLREAKERLNPLVDRTALKAIMAKAERVDNNSVVDGKELQTFLSAYSEAKTTDLKPGVTETEILQATQKLTDAYNAIVLKEDSKNQLVSTALEKADEDVNYFLEKDWKEIQEAKAALEKMKNQTGVLVKDYFEVLDRLETALEHKLSRPVVPSAVEIDSKNFKISANTEQADNAAHNEGPVKYAFDKNPNTIWHSSYNPMFTVSADNPAEITIDMGKSYTINQFSYLQRPVGGNNGKVQKYNLYVKSNQADKWKKIVSDGTFADKQELQKVTFDEVEAQYVKFEVTQGFGNFATAAELAVYQKASDFSKLQEAMDEAEKLDRTKYLEVYYSNIDQLCEEAEELLKDFMTEQAKIDALTEQLQEALDALEVLAAKSDIKLLEEAVEAARNIDLDQYKNTKEFEKALSASEKLLAEYKKEERILQKDVTEAILKLTEEQGKLEEKDPVKPEKPEVDMVVVKAEQTTLKVGVATKVSATIMPEDAKDKAVTWSVSDENILSVSPDGTVTAKKEGKAYVIATSSNGKTGRVEITVVSKDTVSNPESSKDEGKENKKEPMKTGDTQSTAWYIGLMAAVGAVVFGTKKKKEKDEM